MMGAMSPSPDSPDLLVVCLCAQWCGSCREYRDTFRQVAASFSDARFLWIDIEDQADLVDPIEVDNFPTLLIAAGGVPRFFGALTPHKETLVRLLKAQTETSAQRLPDPDVAALVLRLHQLPG